MTFAQKLERACGEKESLLCVGLDPRVGPQEDPFERILEQNRLLIEETLPHTACYKPNIAFYEAHGPQGLKALEETLKLIPEGVPIILDAKRGDIGSTAEAYADSLLGHYKGDAVTLAPYMGREGADPFLKRGEGVGVFVLCRTTNPGAQAFQDLLVPTLGGGREELYLQVARECSSWGPQLGLVVAGNDEEALQRVRALCPNLWFLTPGIGAQGGDITGAVRAGCREDGMGILPSVSRGIAQADDPGKTAKDLKDRLNEGRRKGVFQGMALPGRREKMMKSLIQAGCFQVGEFTLKSGEASPFYIDLRRVCAKPPLLAEVAKAYAELLKGLEFDRLAGIPLAALPLATALSLEVGVPLIYPRMTPKAHGTGNLIEGEYFPGERVLLVDDLITTGKSKVEAIEILRRAGLVVKDLVVLLERGSQGPKDMKAAGITLHSYAHIQELLRPCYDLGLLTKKDLESMLDYAVGE